MMHRLSSFGVLFAATVLFPVLWAVTTQDDENDTLH